MYSQLSKKSIWMLSFGIILFCYCFAMTFGAMTYHTNDDVAWQNMISNFTFDGLWWHTTFSSILLTYPVGLLYYFIPHIPWWYVISQIFVIIGLFITHYVVLRLGQIRKVPFILVLLLLGVFDAVYNLICIAEIAFTIVPVVTGSGIIAVVFYYPYIADNQKTLVKIYIFIGTVISLSHRRQSGILVIVFLLLSIAWLLTQKYGFLKKKMLGYTASIALVFGIIIVGITVSGKYINKISQGEEWQRYSSARSAFLDYAHDSYLENPELYEAVGWDEHLASFAHNWIFLSDEITEEAFRHISENSQTNPANASLLQNLKRSLNTIANSILTRNTVLTSIILLSFTLVWMLYCKDWQTAFFVAVNGLGVAVLLLYLGAIIGRVVFRSVFVILYPAVIVNLFLALSNYKHLANKKSKIICISCLLIAVSIIAVMFYGIVGLLYQHKITYKQFEHNQLILEAYLHNHPESTFVVTGVSKISYKQYSPEPERNTLSTGGSMWKSNWTKQYAIDNGLSAINWEVFEHPNVYYIGDLQDDRTQLFTYYLQEEYGCKGIAVIEPLKDYIGSHCCMKFVYENNENTFDCYYSLVDGVYVEVKTPSNQ